MSLARQILGGQAKTVIESIGNVGSRVRTGGHELVFDQPSGVPGGEDRGPSPLDVMVASVAALTYPHKIPSRIDHLQG